MVQSIALTLALAASTLAAPSRKYQNASSWTSWKDVTELFVFGDSYTQTGFDPTLAQPNAANPFGNPNYPGYTSSNGPNWVGFLTTTYNQSKLLTYNLAYGGATVDSALVKPYQDTVKSVKVQVQDQFLPIYGNVTSKKFTSKSSLFAFFIGINDVGNSWYTTPYTSLWDTIFTEYAGLLDQVYATGARNFLFLNVPPVNLAPLTLNQNDNGYAKQYEGAAIDDWNARLVKLVADLKTRHADVTTFSYDTHKLFSDVIADVNATPQTSVYKNTTGYCDAYQNGTPTWYTSDPSCLYPVNEYLWLNSLHPTFPIHNATAEGISKLLSASKRH